MSGFAARVGAVALAVTALATGVAACREASAPVSSVAGAPASSPVPASGQEATPEQSTTAPSAPPTSTQASVPAAPGTSASTTPTTTPRSTARSTARPTATTATTPPPTSQTGTDAYEDGVLNLVNAERAAAGLPPLTAQACPDRFAEPWSPQMAAQGRLSHQSLSPILSRCGGQTAAENVGMNSSQSPASMVAAFMDSPPHRANILNPAYTRIGVGAYRDARGVWWVTQDFVG
jgi:uncharacterized protein YkwD